MTDIELVLGTDTVLEIDTTTSVVIEDDLLTELDPDGELTLLLIEQTSEIVIEPELLVELEVPGPQGIAGPQGPQGDRGDDGQALQLLVTRTTGQVLGGHRLVTADNDGLAVYADKTTFADVTRPLWLTTGSWGSGVVATLVAFGMVTEPSWTWTPGRLVFLGTDGLLTQVVPNESDATFLVVVGRAVSATEMFYDPDPPIAFVLGYSPAYGDY